MKTKILVAMIACLALGACTKIENEKDKDKAGADQTQGSERKTEPSQPTTPSTPSGTPTTPGQSMNEPASSVAADESSQQQAAQQNLQQSDNNNATEATTMQTSSMHSQNQGYNQDQSNADQHSQPED